TPAFFERTYDGFQVAYYFGFAILIFGPLGIVAGGALADYWRRKGKDDCYLRVALLAALLLTPVNVATPLMPEAWMAVLLLAPGAFLGAMPFGVAPAAVQAITPNQMRAQMSAMYLFTVNLIGLGLGPTVIGWITDDVFGDPMLVRYSLVVTGAATGLWAIAVLSSGLKPYRRAVEAAKEWQDKDEASAPA
ncbi:MAG: MFS transporter, partial [Alphaproteobacteria bacterium]|nr:MFS transporter [Alphaproteobacteria bacterium]